MRSSHLTSISRDTHSLSTDLPHADDSPQQRHALRAMDGNVGIIADAVRRRAAAENEDWLIVVTTDHGRDPLNGKNHGGQSRRERIIWIATDSQRLNERFADNPAIVDILPSIASHMGLNVPDEVVAQLDGRSFID